jgi:DNA-binding transcriptional regulator YhcF (GntR family)
VKADTLFAVVPEWIVYAEIGPQAVRLYAALARHADKETGHAHPSRRRLAELLRCSADTIDRALKELVEVGAITVQTRKIVGTKEHATNDYIVHVVPIRSRADAATGDRMDAEIGSRTDAAVNESHLERESEEREKTDLAARTDDDFERFFAAFPTARKGSRREVRKAWDSALKRKGNPGTEVMVAGAERYRDDPNREDEFTKGGAAWLNADRWEDGPLPSRASGTRERADWQGDAIKAALGG